MNIAFDELKLTGSLPSPSGVGLQILQLTQNEDFSAEELAQTIQSDPALTGRIIKMANSAQIGGVKPIATVAESVVRLGASAVRNVALGFSLVSGYRSGKCAAFDFNRFWSESLARAILAQMIARDFKIAQPAEAYICGLLASVGKLALATVHPSAYSEVIANPNNREEDRLLAAESEKFGIDNRAVASAMLTDWRIPLAQREAIQSHEDADGSKKNDVTSRLRLVLRLSFPLAAILAGDGKDRALQFGRIEREVLANNLPMERLFEIVDKAAADWVEWGKMLALPTQKVAPIKEIYESTQQAAPTLTPPTERAAAAPPAVNSAPRGDAAITQVFEKWRAEELTREKMIVLAADDDAVTRRILATHLKKAGFQVVEAKDGKDALAKALEHNPHIVITDWQMPELDGVTVCNRLRETEIGRRMYVLVLTGTDGEEHVIRAFDAGADDYITKPLNPRVLLARVTAGERLARLQDRVEKDQQRMRDQLAQMAILNRKLRETAVTDALTGLPNRRYAIKMLEELWGREGQFPSNVSVVMFDIDHFKKVNDTFGHDAGDAVLKEVAKILASKLRSSDRVCRLGGEEFVVICPGCPLDNAVRVGDRLREAIAGHRITFKNFDQNVTVSGGVAERVASMRHHDDLLKAADEALYASKHGGRNKITAFSGI